MKTRTLDSSFRTVLVSLNLALIGGACQRAPSTADVQSASARDDASAPLATAAREESEPAKEKKAESFAAGKGQGLATGSGAILPEAPQPSVASALAQPLEAAPVGAPPPPASPQRRLAARAKPAPHAVLSTPAPDTDAEAYAATADSNFANVASSPLSTFSIDVDTASYSNVRRFLTQGQLPPAGAVRVEELINYFPYAYADPTDSAPIRVTSEVSDAPWNPEHRLLHVGLQGKRIATADLPPRNMVFLVDVSGSMSDENKLPLLKRSLVTMTQTLSERDRVAIVVYAGASGMVLPPTSGADKSGITAALERLEAGGSTNGGEGLELAYSVATGLARPGATTRVILATDGDFNVGPTSEDALQRLIVDKRKSGVFLSVLGFGMGNLEDSTLEMLADKGNGNYAYVDSLAEARKVLVAEAGATLVTLAQDVKLQLEFNPEKVASYRLIGYENRRLADQDFNDDRKDAGELGAGHSVTALYELIPPGAAGGPAAVDPLKYQAVGAPRAGHSGELCTIKLRYKAPGGAQSQKLEQAVKDAHVALEKTSPAFRFSAAVAAFGMTLRQTPERGTSDFGLARRLAEGALGRDLDGYQREFISLVDTAARLDAASRPRPLAMP